MRKSSLTPDETMRRQLYSPLKNLPKDKKSINIIGNDRSTHKTSELYKMLVSAGYEIHDITECKNYDEYLAMAKSKYNITYLPAAQAAGAELEKRLSQKNIYLPLCYSEDEIALNYMKLCDELNIKMPDFSSQRIKARKDLESAFKIIGNTPVEIDYTSVPRPLSLARMLCSGGFNVKKIYADAFVNEDKEDFEFLKHNFPDITISASVDPQMRFVRGNGRKVLAIGQKAAYFSSSRNFVNIVSGGGMYGFEGISELCGLMTDAFLNEKDTKEVISHKGLGCESCI
jgi:hypothetical protein